MTDTVTKTTTTTTRRNFYDEEPMRATSPSVAALSETDMVFLPDYAEHPMPKPRKKITRIVTAGSTGATPPPAHHELHQDGDVTFVQDFVAGGMAGSASVVVGHPFDTIKVRMQTCAKATSLRGILSSLGEFGGVSSLFRGVTAPLFSATAVNAIIFSSYGASSRFYDDYLVGHNGGGGIYGTFNHDPVQKAVACGSFTGLVQCLVICPMEHIKCRLQVQRGTGGASSFRGPVDAVRTIVSDHGVRGLYRGWWSSSLREVPAFGLYFATYDYLKDRAFEFLSSRSRSRHDDDQHQQRSHRWIASVFAGGCSGCLTWAIVYPVDVIKTRVQTAPFDAAHAELAMWNVGRSLVAEHGWRYLFRGMSVTLIRAFPVNGTVFPVYEFTLQQMSRLGGGAAGGERR